MKTNEPKRYESLRSRVGLHVCFSACMKKIPEYWLNAAMDYLLAAKHRLHRKNPNSTHNCAINVLILTICCKFA